MEDTIQTVTVENGGAVSSETTQALRYKGIHKKIGQYRALFDTLLQVDAAKKLASSIGYDQAKVQEGKALLAEVTTMLEHHQVTKGRSESLTEVVRGLRQEVMREYMQHLKQARLQLKGQTGLLETMGANGKRKVDFERWRFDVQVFYKIVLETPEVLEALARNKVTEKALKATQKKLDELIALHHDMMQHRQEAQKQTVARNEATKQLTDWVSAFRQTARAQYFHNRQNRIILGV